MFVFLLIINHCCWEVGSAFDVIEREVVSERNLNEKQLNAHQRLPDHHHHQEHVLVRQVLVEEQFDEVLLEDDHEQQESVDHRVFEGVVSLADVLRQLVVQRQQVHDAESKGDLQDVEYVEVQDLRGRGVARVLGVQFVRGHNEVLQSKGFLEHKHD